MIRAYVVLLLASLPVLAADPGAISGKVVHALSGEPLARVTVSLRGPRGVTPPRQIETGADGMFRFAEVPPGRWRIGGQRTGFVPQEYGPRVVRFPGEVLEVKSGEEIEDLVFKLTPAGVIAGRVVDDEGDPVMAIVRLYRSSPYSATPVATASERVPISEDGTFRFGNLAPGVYFIRVDPGPTGPPRAKVPGQPEAFLAGAWYPAAASSASAQAIKISPGETASGYTVALRRVTGFRISGRIAGLAEGDRVSIVLRPPIGNELDQPRGASGGAGAEGRFTIGPIEAGEYTMSFEAWQRGGQPVALGTQTIAVHGDMEDLTITLPPKRKVTGRVVNESGSAASARVVMFMSPSGTYVATDRIQPDGRFDLESLPAGWYTASVNLVDQPAIVMGARVGGRRSAGPSFEIGGSDPGEIELTVSLDTVALTGEVTDGETPALAAVVTAMPDGNDMSRFQPMRSASTSRDGKFSIDLPPGRYRAAAWIEMPPAQALRPGGFKTYLAKSVVIDVKKGEKPKAVSLELMHPEPPE